VNNANLSDYEGTPPTASDIQPRWSVLFLRGNIHLGFASGRLA